MSCWRAIRLMPTLLAVIACFAVIASAEPPLTITPSGYYLTHTDADGVPSFSRIENVTDLRGGVDPKPDDPAKPDKPAVDEALIAKAKEWATVVDDPQSAQAISAVYSHIRGALSDGTLTSESVWGPLRQATDSALGVIAEGKDWSEFRTKLTAEFNDAKQRGKLGTAGQIAVVLLSVQHGVELAADGSSAISMDQLVEISRRTNLAIDGVAK